MLKLRLCASHPLLLSGGSGRKREPLRTVVTSVAIASISASVAFAERVEVPGFIILGHADCVLQCAASFPDLDEDYDDCVTKCDQVECMADCAGGQSDCVHDCGIDPYPDFETCLDECAESAACCNEACVSGSSAPVASSGQTAVDVEEVYEAIARAEIVERTRWAPVDAIDVVVALRELWETPCSEVVRSRFTYPYCAALAEEIARSESQAASELAKALSKEMAAQMAQSRLLAVPNDDRSRY